MHMQLPEGYMQTIEKEQTGNPTQSQPQAPAPVTRDTFYKVEAQRGSARIKIRYIEGNHPVTGCTFCA